MKTHSPTGMRTFIMVWISQALSLLGSSMTGFGLTIWAYETTNSVTALSLTGFFFVVPMLVFSPVAGAIVDRSNRKLMMMLSDMAAGLVTLGIFLLYSTGNLQIWHLYIGNFIVGIFQTFQWPAYSAAITMMVPKEQYGRASGLTQLVENGSNIFAPIAASAVLGLFGLQAVFMIDLVTVSLALGALLIARIPQPAATAEGKAGAGSLLKESLFGFKYIFARPSLLGLQLIFLGGNFFATIFHSVVSPMVLARTGSSEIALGTVQSAGAIGGVVGALIMSAWGGPKRRVHGVLGGWILISLSGALLFGLGQALPVWIAANFIAALFIPMLNGSNQAIWQAKVAPDVQGRVFSVRRLIAWFVNPLAMLIAGWLADTIMEPGMQVGGALEPAFGWLVGSGAGSGMALMMVGAALGSALVGISGYAFPAVRNAESLLPDHQALAVVEAGELAAATPAPAD